MQKLISKKTILFFKHINTQYAVLMTPRIQTRNISAVIPAMYVFNMRKNVLFAT